MDSKLCEEITMKQRLKAIKPTPELNNLRLLVLAHPKLTSGAGINFHLEPWSDGSIDVGMVYSFGDRRDPRTTPPVCEDDVEALVQSINDWIGGVPTVSKWTEDLSEADRLNWGG
jgi:hypothetical protein